MWWEKPVITKMTCRPSSAPPLGSPVLFRCCLTHAPHFSSLGIKGAQPVFQSCYKDGKQCLHSPESLRGPGRILLDYYVLSIEQKVVGGWVQHCCFANPSLHLWACIAEIGPRVRKHGFQYLECHTSKCHVSGYIAAMHVQNMYESISENL